MRLYLGPESSLELIRYLRSVNEGEGLGGVLSRKRSIDDAIHTVHALKELDDTAQRWLEHITSPIQAYVSGHESGANTINLKTRVMGVSVPYGSFIDVGHSISVCSPGMLLAKLAESTGIIDVITTGMELCGTYSKWCLEPDRMDSSYYSLHEEMQGCTFGLPPMARAAVVDSFIERNSRIRGAAIAKRATTWVIDGAASPMEAAVYMLLCLPKRLGGYGLSKPTMNPKLLISNPDGVKERYPDLFWPGANIDIEYNSDAKHSGEWSRYRDSKREIELTVANLRVLPLTRPQLMNVDDFDAFANGLRRMLGVRSRDKDALWESRRAALRRKVLGC